MSDPVRAAAKAGTLARFELLREIGQGAQARVWLAYDPRLEREVAIKLLKPGADRLSLSACLAEACAVSRLSHPNIVPVFEADEHQGQPYLVFEFVDGPTLAQALRQQPGWPAHKCVALMLGVLDGLEAAHEHGVVHRDLKPSDILLGSDGRARVMDFGIAGRLKAGQDGVSARVAGTPAYMSPEAARGMTPMPAMDVFSAGAVLAEMLCGHPLLQETDPQRALQRAQDEALQLPEQTPIDATLRSIVQRALARDPTQRFDSARALHTALSAWLNPAAAAPASTQNNHATLDFLLRRMRHRSDFPTLSGAVMRIQRVAGSETDSIRALTDAILEDVALTHKLLRMVNTAHYSGVAAGGIGTVSRAVALVGFPGVRNMALSLVLLDHMPDKAHAVLLKAEFLRALMVGMLAAELAPQGAAGEDAFLGAMLQNLGRLLTEYYLPEEAAQIRQLLGNDQAPTAAREAAAKRVLGIGYDELSAGVARVWDLPNSLQRALRRPLGELPTVDDERPPIQGVERLRWLGRVANALVDAMQGGPGEAQALADVAARHAPVLRLEPVVLLQAVQVTRRQLVETAHALGLSLPQGSSARRLIDPPPAAKADTGASHWAPTAPMPLPPPAQELLLTALQSAEKARLAGAMDVSELLHLVLDSLHHALHLRNVVLCLREPGGTRLAGRVGLGPGGAEASAAFRFTPDAGATQDLFAVVCARGADQLVADASTVAHRLPGWYRRRVDAPTFLLLPLMVKGQAIGMIYADKARAGSLVLEKQELTLVRALRDQVTAAFARLA